MVSNLDISRENRLKELEETIVSVKSELEKAMQYLDDIIPDEKSIDELMDFTTESKWGNTVGVRDYILLVVLPDLKKLAGILEGIHVVIGE